MNRDDFQRLSDVRLQEARALLTAGLPEGAYYLAGYAVECALKACIAKRTQQHDFPEKGSHRYFIHNLDELVGLADLRAELNDKIQRDSTFKDQWTLVKNWSEESRYDQGRTAQEASNLIDAIENPKGGTLTWLRRLW